MKTYQARLSSVILMVALAGIVEIPTHAQTGRNNRQNAGEPLQPVALSAQEAVDYAMKNSQTVRNALIDVQLQQQKNREITSQALPQITGSVNVTKYVDLPTQLIPAEFFGGPPGTFQPIQFGTEYNGTYGVNLEQVIFDGQVFVGLQAREASIDYANANVNVTKEMIKANVYKIYYQLVVGQRQITTLDANITRTEKLLHDTKALYENGFAEKLDVDKVSVNLSNLRTEKTRLENQLRTGYIGLKFLMGMPVRTPLTLTDTLSDDMVKDNLLFDTVRYEDRKEYQLLQSVEKLNKYDIKRHQFTYIPRISITGNYSRNAQRDKFNFFKKGEDWFTITYIGVQINVPIFDGFAKASRVRSARLNLQQTQNRLENLRNQIDMEVDSALISIRNAIATLDLQRQNMELAMEVYNQTKIKYENGLGSTLEITNAEADLRTAQNNYYAALYDAVVARIDYLKAAGKL